MSENVQPNQNNNSEEIDLGQLFKMIGDGFRKFFNFIGNIIKGIFGIIIAFLLFIQLHIIKFIIAGVIGVVIGGYLDYRKEPVYVSTMVLEPNFQSVQQLYNNINFYNDIPLTVELPNQVTCKILTTDVALKGQTVSSSYKPATLDNGINIQVPPFIESGDMILVDTRNAEYIKKI